MSIINRDELKRIVRNNDLHGVNDFKNLMGDLTRTVVEVMLEGELTGFLGYEKHDHSGKAATDFLGLNSNN